MTANQFNYFSIHEFACPCCGKNEMDKKLVRHLDTLRHDIYSPIIINSGYRCSEHNKKINGAKDSFHMLGLAADISFNQKIAGKFRYKLLREIFMDGFFRGVGIHDNFIHVDCRANQSAWIYQA